MRKQEEINTTVTVRLAELSSSVFKLKTDGI